MHQLVVLLQSANQVELLLTAAAGTASIVTAARGAADDVAGSGSERRHTDLCTCQDGDTSHCPARDSL
ncbi:hypothetical protein MMUC44124_01710 [Mycolicibacterium mucogenicum DSM 44124]|uniref:Uncharacterized protein n=1 Tax=Mycolicibacterium mucogenicum DSM 44124 TaxID=1226753 RepID=A0A8H2J9A9_MYCMU|nr:hypothetical protein MMUC44124_01710 [Mycolicibacterium mucogenicum DSM 44124]